MTSKQESQEWVKSVGDSLVFVGISHSMQQELGEIVYIELPTIGQKLEKGALLAVVESTKAATDFYSPVSGEVIEINEKLKENPSLINQSPEDEGWICKMRV